MVQAVKDAVDGIGAPDNLAAAQELIPDAVLDWADTIIYHHYLHRLYGQWPRIADWLRGDPNRRVIWRTVGQSVDGNERDAQQFHREGMEIVRYSPKERNIPNFAGQDALIRFYKDPDEWYGWTGEDAVVGNVTQQLLQRDPYTNFGFWRDATEGLPTLPAGPGSNAIGGLGSLDYHEMQAYLRRIRCYLYTGYPAGVLHPRADRGDDDRRAGRVHRAGAHAAVPLRRQDVRGAPDRAHVDR